MTTAGGFGFIPAGDLFARKRLPTSEGGPMTGDDEPGIADDLATAVMLALAEDD